MTMRPGCFLFALLLSQAAVGAGSVAHAGAPPTFIASERAASDRADELLKRGLGLAKADRWAEAEPLIREAWGLKRSYDIAGNLGIVEAELSKWRDAAEHLTYAFKTFPVNGKPEQKKLLDATLGRVLPHVAAMMIKVSVDKADVFVDGKSVGTSPLSEVVFVEPGSRTIEARRQGYDAATRVYDAQTGSSGELVLVMREQAPPPPTARVGTSPPPPPPWKPGVGLVAAAGALAVSGLAVGAGFTVAANGKASSAAELGAKIGGGDSGCARPTGSVAGDCKTLHDMVASKGTFSNVAVAGFVTGGVFALATAGLGIWAASSPRSTPVQVAPAVGMGQAGVVVQGAW